MKKSLYTFFILSILFSACKKEDSTATCSDGIKNGTETGIDCGGSCTACGTTPTCSDGIQNGTETGIDCGGTCTACVVAPCYNGIQDGTETFVDCGGSCAACPTIFMNGKLDGVPFQYSSISQSAPYDGGFGVWGSGNSEFSAGGLIGSYADIGMGKNRIGITSYPSSSEYVGLFSVGTRTYRDAHATTPPPSEGVSIMVKDSNGDFWYSSYTSTNTSSTFTITSCSTWSPGTPYVIYKGNFSCKVAKDNTLTPQTKTLTGSFSMYGYVKP